MLLVSGNISGPASGLFGQGFDKAGVKGVAEVGGGWNLLGRTATRLFDPQREDYSLFTPGDRVRFVAIDRDTFVGQGGDVTPMATEQ